MPACWAEAIRILHTAKPNGLYSGHGSGLTRTATAGFFAKCFAAPTLSGKMRCTSRLGCANYHGDFPGTAMARFSGCTQLGIDASAASSTLLIWKEVPAGTTDAP